MAKELKLPRLSEDADEGTVAEVMIKEGDTIGKDDSVIAVESDKATVEVPAEQAGTVKEVKVSEGDTIKTGDVIAVLEDEDEQEEEKEEKSEEGEEQKKKSKKKEEEKEDKSAKKEESEKQQVEDEETENDEEPNKEQEEDVEKEPADEQEEPDESEAKSEETDKKEEEEAPPSKDIHAAPGAKQLAREHDINIEDIEGSGPDGLVTADDVKKAAGLGSEEKPVSATLPDFSKWGTIERQPLSQIRKATAKQTQTSWQAIPHVTQFDEANVSGIEEYIEQHREKVEERGGKITVTAVLTKVIANALHRFPKFNASIDMEAGEAIFKKYIHIGIAADTEEGLLVPVIRDVDEKSIIELAVEIDKLAEQARDGKLSKEDMEGGDFIISNLGGIGGTQFTPVIFHPQVAILGVSAMETKPVYSEESNSFQPVLTLPLSLSYDHRLIDGAEGARFLRYLCDALEDPYKALLGE